MIFMPIALSILCFKLAYANRLDRQTIATNKGILQLMAPGGGLGLPSDLHYDFVYWHLGYASR